MGVEKIIASEKTSLEINFNFNRPFPKSRHNIIIFNLIFRKNKVQIRFSRQKICIR